MNKKIITYFILSIILIFTANIAFADENGNSTDNSPQSDIVNATSGGARNITFDNGYNGYCINMTKHPAEINDNFTIVDTSHAMNRFYNESIGNYIKIFFVDFTDIALNDSNNSSEIIWTFTDRYYKDSTNPTVQSILELAENGRVVADHGEVKKINNTTEIIFDFIVLNTLKEDIQNYFGYKLSYQTINDTLSDETNVNGTNETADNVTYVNETNETFDNGTVDNVTYVNETNETFDNSTNGTFDNETLNNESINDSDGAIISENETNKTDNINHTSSNLNDNNETNITTNMANESNQFAVGKTTGNPILIPLIFLSILGFIPFKRN